MFAKTLLALFAGAAAVSAAPTEKRSAYYTDLAENKVIEGGRATFYTVTESEGYCGGWNKESQYVVAMNRPQLEGDAMCHNYVEITNTENGNKQVAQIVDECPGCKYGDLDMSKDLFAALSGRKDWKDQGVFPITYQFLPVDYNPPADSPAPQKS